MLVNVRVLLEILSGVQLSFSTWWQVNVEIVFENMIGAQLSFHEFLLQKDFEHITKVQVLSQRWVLKLCIEHWISKKVK